MLLYKAKVEKSEQGEIKKLEGNYGTGYGLRVQAVLYSSSNPGNFLHLYDADGDEFLFPISGQGNPKVLLIDAPIAVKLPLSYLDISLGENEIKVWGEVERLSSIETSL